MSQPSTRPYRPSTSAASEQFYTDFCGRCWRELIEECPILTATLVHDITAPEYPREWIEDAAGGNPRCTAFAPITEPRPGCGSSMTLAGQLLAGDGARLDCRAGFSLTRKGFQAQTLEIFESF